MKKQVNMLEGPLILKILLYAIPLCLSGMLQQLFNAVDGAVVGTFAGNEALAAVGANSSLCTVFINAFIGLSVGTNVLISQYIGSKQTNKIPEAIHSVILFSIIGGFIVMLFGEIFAKQILLIMGTPNNIIDHSVLYLRFFLLGLPFLATFNFGSAIVRSEGNTKRPMICLMIAGTVNVLLNLLLVIVFKLGVIGVAVATAFSNVLSCSLILYTLCKYEHYMHLDLHKLKFKKEPMRLMFKYGAPAALQAMVFSIANVSIQSGVNTFGSNVVAGNTAAMNFEYIDYQVVNSFNQSAVTFVGQNFAAGKYDRVKRIYAICMIEALIGFMCMSMFFWFSKATTISLFTGKEIVKQYAYVRTMMVTVPNVLVCSYEITGSVLRGMGHSLEPALLTVIGSVGLRVLWLLTVFQKWHDYKILLLVYPISWIFTGSMVITCYILISRKVFNKNSEA